MYVGMYDIVLYVRENVYIWYVCMYVCMHVCMCVCREYYVRMFVSVCMYAFMDFYTYMYVCTRSMYVCMHICMNVCVYVHMRLRIPVLNKEECMWISIGNNENNVRA